LPIDTRAGATLAHNLAEAPERPHLRLMLRACDSVLQIPPGDLRCLRPRGHTGLCRALGRNDVIYFGRPAEGRNVPRRKTQGGSRRRSVTSEQETESR
jgi:hypothetical protein